MPSWPTPGSLQTSYSYDAKGRLTTVNDYMNSVTTYAYNDASKQKQVSESGRTARVRAAQPCLSIRTG
ncbi:MAG: RHS repeat domain-containing protein [Planctomycetota bacterium]|nr:RHS repeat domain-containing protein [Planctomycetota bacterium]